MADTGTGGMPGFDIPGMPGGSVGVLNINDMLQKAMGGKKTKTRKTTVKESYDLLINDESDKLLDQDEVVRQALESTENDGIVFLDEIDKIAARSGVVGGPSREGVQRDLLPLVEGTTVATKYGPMKTDHILFIASGAFHVSKPSDLLPELQGRLPIRVELRALEKDDFVRILTETEASLIKQYIALMKTEGVELDFTPDAIDWLAQIAVDLNANVENIGARRLQTVMERVLDDISFNAPDKSGTTLKVDAAYVEKHVGDLSQQHRFVAIYPVKPGSGQIGGDGNAICRPDAQTGRCVAEWKHSATSRGRVRHSSSLPSTRRGAFPSLRGNIEGQPSGAAANDQAGIFRTGIFARVACCRVSCRGTRPSLPRRPSCRRATASSSSPACPAARPSAPRPADHLRRQVPQGLRAAEERRARCAPRSGEAASAYGIDPMHIVGAIVGEHTYNVDAYDRLQTYYVKAVAYLKSRPLLRL